MVSPLRMAGSGRSGSGSLSIPRSEAASDLDQRLRIAAGGQPIDRRQLRALKLQLRDRVRQPALDGDRMEGAGERLEHPIDARHLATRGELEPGQTPDPTRLDPVQRALGQPLSNATLVDG